jgi:hypothetical protein
MTQDEVVELMKVITRYDNRPPSVEVAQAWYASANIAGWTLAEATEAVARHFTYSTEYLKPAHVTALIEERRHPRRDRADSISVRAALPPTDEPPASDEARAAAKALLARYPQFADTVGLPEERKPRRRTRTAADIERRRIAEAELARLRRNPTPEGA